MEGWVKTYRQILEWEWYRDIYVKSVFFHLVLTANHKDAKWQGKEIKRGQLITSREHLAVEVGISIQQVRTALKKLEKTGEITIKSTNKFTLITIEKYDIYQSCEVDINQQVNQQSTSNQPTTNQQSTTNKNDKNNKNDNNENNISKKENNKSFNELIENYTKNVELQNELKEHLKTRKSKKATLTNRAIELSLKKLDELCKDVSDELKDEEKIEIVQQSIQNGWTGFFELKDKHRHDDYNWEFEDL